MKPVRFNFYRMALLFFAVSLMAAGCVTTAYTPRPDNVPKISYAEAGRNLMALKASRIFVRGHYCNIADVKIGFDTVDIIYRKQTIFNIETGETGIETIHLKTFQVPPVSTQAGNAAYFMNLSKNRMLLFRTQNEAIACANALFILKRRAEGYTPPKDAAAEAAFQEEARKYRAMRVKPALPEEAHKYAVQGDFAVEKKNLDAAADRYADALKVAPWWPEGHFKRGLVLADLERYDEGIDEMKKFLLLAPEAKEARAAQDNIYKWEGAESWNTPQAAAASAFTGTIKSFTPTNPRWYGSDVVGVIEAVADNGTKATFIVFKTTTMQDMNGNVVSDIRKDKKAEIKYSIITDSNSRINGKNKAISIRYLE
jgi:pyruvate/2-oxoglutarate dehydrogenase complex dihydrolipoamide acyltransferase (E2) component